MSIFKQFTKTLKAGDHSKSGSIVKKHERLLPDQSKVIAEKKAERILFEAKTEARNTVINAKDEAIQIRVKSEARANWLQDNLIRRQEQLSAKQTLLAKTQAALSAREQFLDSQKQAVKDKAKYLSDLDETYLNALLEVTTTKIEDAKEEMWQRLKKRLDLEQAHIVSEASSRIETDVDFYVQDLLSTVMTRGGMNYQSDYSAPIVRVANGRAMQELLGTKNCNQEFFEQLVKVELVIDDLTIKVNSIDSVDREIGRQTLERLLEMRRVNPALIRKVYQRVVRETEEIMFKTGKQLCHSVGVYNMPRDIIAKLGRFTYRHSYGQNMIQHTLEETLIGISLAHELGVDSNVVRLGCLFHDIGKVIHDDEGTHVETGVAYLKEQNIPQAVIDCVAQSHEDEPFSSIESIIVHIADGISGARPAARQNDHEFANRIKYLETTPYDYPGVKDAYAIQAGREVRVIVDPKKLSDEDIKTLAQQLRDRIKSELTYPGSVTVNVIREVTSSITVNTPSNQQT